MNLNPSAHELATLTVSHEQMADIAYLLYKGWSDDSVSKQMRLPIAKIQEIRLAHPETAAAHKDFVISKLNEFVSRGVERICNQIDEMHIDKLPLALGIIIDKAQLLQGQATTRIDTSHGMSQEKLIDVLERMKRASTAKANGVVEALEIGEPSEHN